MQELKQIKTEDVCAAIEKAKQFSDNQSLRKERSIGFSVSEKTVESEIVPWQ